jgi:hypothetical protein
MSYLLRSEAAEINTVQGVLRACPVGDPSNDCLSSSRPSPLVSDHALEAPVCSTGQKPALWDLGLLVRKMFPLARSCAVFRGERGWGAQWERAGGCVQIHRGLWESAHHNAEPDLT